MGLRWVVILLIVCTSCQSGLIPCPTVRADKVKRSSARKAFYSPRMVTASAKEVKPEKPTEPVKRKPYVRPVLEHVDVEEWDCPKPGQKKMPKAVKDNIRKNKKAYESYYKSRNEADSLYQTSER